MNRTVRISVPLLALLAFGCACNKANTTSGSGAATGGGEPSNDTVIATIGEKKITWGEFNEKFGDDLYKKRRELLEQMINEELAEAEAKKRGITVEELFKQEIEQKTPLQNEEQLKQVFEQFKQNLPPEATYDEYKHRIAQQFNPQPYQQRAGQYFQELRAAAKVDVSLPQPRIKVEATGPAKGPENAPVTIVEFSDFECPFCGRAAETVNQVMEQYAGKVRLVFRHFPLDFHKKAPKASEAAMCAGEQGKFWEFHDLLFKNQDKLLPDELKQHAASLGLDKAKFDACLDGGQFAETVKKDLAAGREVGVSGTPAFFINGVRLSGAQPIEEFKKVIDAELQAKK